MEGFADTSGSGLERSFDKPFVFSCHSGMLIKFVQTEVGKRMTAILLEKQRNAAMFKKQVFIEPGKQCLRISLLYFLSIFQRPV